MSDGIAAILEKCAGEVGQAATPFGSQWELVLTLLELTDATKAKFVADALRHYREECTTCLAHVPRVLSPSGSRRVRTSSLDARWRHARLMELPGFEAFWIGTAAALQCDRPMRSVDDPDKAALAAVHRLIGSPQWAAKYRGTAKGAWKMLKAVYVARGGSSADADNLDQGERDA